MGAGFAQSLGLACLAVCSPGLRPRTTLTRNNLYTFLQDFLKEIINDEDP